MKPSERRALESERKAREAAEWREKELEKQAKKAAKKAGEAYKPQEEAVDTERIDTTATYTKLPEKEIEVKGDGYHRESFFSNNARIIAFIVTTVLVLFVFGPLGYDIYLNVSDYLERGDAVEGKVMNEETLLSIAGSGKYLTWGDLESYEHTSLSDGNVIEIAVEGTNLTLHVEKAKKGDYPEIVRLIDYANGTYIDDVRYAKTSEIKDFIASPDSDDKVKADGEYDGKSMIKKEMLSLAEKGASLTWKDFEEYAHTSSEEGTVMEIEVLGTDYTLRVWRNKDRTYPIFVRLIHDSCGEYLNDVQYANDGAIEEFMATHSAEGKN